MKIAVGLSGGVDSAVAALLLKEAGHEVVGITMKLWRGQYRGGDRAGCFGPHEDENIARARALAEAIGIDYRVYDCSAAYDETVVRYFRETYLRGQTPNPCVRCNATMKFGLLPRLAAEAGLVFDKFATGHYARVAEYRRRGVPAASNEDGSSSYRRRDVPAASNEDGSSASDAARTPRPRMMLLRAKDLSKDQSYFLCRLSQEQLARQLFPLGELTKEQVRALARTRGLVAADRPDSQDFYTGDTAELIGAPDRPGDIVDTAGRKLGTHAGFWHYTVGQRKGLGLGGGGTPWYVVDLNACRNEVVVGRADEAVRTELSVADLHWVSMPPTDAPLACRVKVRSAGKLVPATLTGTHCTFPSGIAGIAPGQSAVFYGADDDRLLCAGEIR